MSVTNFQSTIHIKASSSDVFKALTSEISKWWTKEFKGQSRNMLDEFTVRFGSSHKTMVVVGVIQDIRVVWECLDAVIDLPELDNKSEWEGTRMGWTIDEEDSYTNLSLMHVGLTPELECYQVCEQGWNTYMQSLKQYLETGTGKPYHRNN
jgi:uncharacterized protein YndB with AHSA1/START domain